MSLNGALQVGRSALTASQAALQVAGNNMANATTPGFHRRVVHMAAARDEIVGRNQFIGQGVDLLRVQRVVDTALQSRLRDAVSQEHGALIDQRFLTAIESLQNELSDYDLSSLLGEFFNNFSELANNPEDHAVRSVVIQQGITLSNHIATLRRDYGVVLNDIDNALGSASDKVNMILDQIGLVNLRIAQTEQGVSEASALRDRRDQLIDELAQYMDVTSIEQPSGAADVLVGSTPIVLAGESRGIEMRMTSSNGQIEVSVRVAADGTKLDVGAGRIGALLRQRGDTVQPAIDDLDTFAAQLIFQVNRLHSQGQGRQGHTSIEGTYGVDDTTVALNSSIANLPFDVGNGSFFIHVTHSETGIRNTYRIDVDGNTDSMDDLINEINVVVAVPNVTAGTNLEDALTLTAAAGFEISFSDDTSDVLAALGLNTLFIGEDAASIDVHQTVQDDPDLLAAGSGHVPGSNGTALAISELRNTPVTDLSGRSLTEFWLNSVNRLAVKAYAANGSIQSSTLVRESIEAQVLAVSGVSLDEESINLLAYERQFQAAARFINVIDETLQILLSLV